LAPVHIGREGERERREREQRKIGIKREGDSMSVRVLRRIRLGVLE
jgi:hypothetical protein